MRHRRHRAAATRLAIYAAIAANLAIAVTKFGAAAITHSSAMISEGLHSVVDTGDGLLLLLGLRLSRRPPTRKHPYGHGLEVYFWSMVVAMSIFGMGAVASIYEGVTRMAHPRPMQSAAWGYGVLVSAFVFEGISWFVSIHNFRRHQGKRSLISAIEHSKDPSTFVVVLEDSAALAGILVALTGITLARVFDMPELDSAASIVIGLILVAVALILGRETRSLLLGESAAHEVVDNIQKIANGQPEIVEARRPRTMHLGPHQIHVDLDIKVEPGRTAAELENVFDRLEASVREQHPQVAKLSVRLVH